jgi:hypothetical protein
VVDAPLVHRARVEVRRRVRERQVAGYLKLTATIWNDGVAMYYVSRIHEFEMFSAYARLMDNAYLSWAVSVFTIVFEIAVPYVIFTRRAWLRKTVTIALEGMHIGIMACMGLVAFGLIMIGADSTLLTDRDYHALAAAGRKALRRTSTTRHATTHHVPPLYDRGETLAPVADMPHEQPGGEDQQCAPTQTLSAR